MFSFWNAKYFVLPASRASGPTWLNSEIIQVTDLGSFYFLLPSSQLAKQEQYSGSLVLILPGLGGLSRLESYTPQQAFSLHNSL